MRRRRCRRRRFSNCPRLSGNLGDLLRRRATASRARSHRRWPRACGSPDAQALLIEICKERRIARAAARSARSASRCKADCRPRRDLREDAALPPASRGSSPTSFWCMSRYSPHHKSVSSWRAGTRGFIGWRCQVRRATCSPPRDCL